jgi:hypothetical protein
MNNNSSNESINLEYISLISFVNDDNSLDLKISNKKPLEEIESNIFSIYKENKNEKIIEFNDYNNYSSFLYSPKMCTEIVDDKISIKRDSIDKRSTNSNYMHAISNPMRGGNSNGIIIAVNQNKKSKNILYRKDGYYKHFKVIFGRYLKNRVNKLKNICFPNYSKNNFSTPNYKYIGNPKEKDNYYFLSFTIKDILIYGKEKKNQNRQYNNLLLINYIEKNKEKAKDKNIYEKLILFLNDKLENVFIDFYNDKNEFERINNDKNCIFFDKYFKKEMGFSLLEKNGFLKAIKRKIVK